MTDVPERLSLERHRDLEGMRDVGVRRAGVAVVAIVAALALANVFGQRPGTATATAPAAALDLYAPTHLRSGLIYEARFTIRAGRELRDTTLVLDPGWAEGTTINTIAPSPVGETSRDGRLVLELGHVPRGEKLVLYLQLQVNPTNVGRRSQDVRLLDGGEELVHLDRTVTIFP